MKYSAINYVPKINPDSAEVLSLIYTPGVGAACMKIKEDINNSFVYTNRPNSVAVIAETYEKALERSIFLKSTLNIDAYPLELKLDFEFVISNIALNFCGIDLSLIDCTAFDCEVPIYKSGDVKECFKPVSKNIFNFNINNLKGSLQENSLYLREKAGGVIESELGTGVHKKPVAIISDGSAVLGFGNIGAEAGIPVMEGKAVLFRALGGVNAISLCLKTQEPNEIIKITQLLQNSFSGVNLEDISAPRCFDIEKKLIETLDIPVFHDDQHGTAIVVLAALLNALKIKELTNPKIVISGAGAAAQAVSKLIRKAGFKNIIHIDRAGIVYKNRVENDEYLDILARETNFNNQKGTLQDALVGADVFIGLSAGGILKPEFIKNMNKNPIIFALANPVPEIMPDLAVEAGAFIVATGRSDFDNQINNSLAFPGLFAGVLENGIKKITDEMKLKCAIAISKIIENPTRTNILPKALDKRVPDMIKSELSFN